MIGKKGMAEDKMGGWHHWLDGHEFEQALEDGERWEAWRAAVDGVAKSQTGLRDWTDQIDWVTVSQLQMTLKVIIPLCQRR